MRFLLALLAALILAGPLAASAQGGSVAEVVVDVGAPLHKKARDYGQRELDFLTKELKSDVEKALRREGRLGAPGLRLELTIVDASPNRPTFAQLSHNPSLSIQSLSVGGIKIEGVEIAADGSRRPIAYRWYETSLRSEIAASTWWDAEHGIERFADQYAKGEL